MPSPISHPMAVNIIRLGRHPLTTLRLAVLAAGAEGAIVDDLVPDEFEEQIELCHSFLFSEDKSREEKTGPKDRSMDRDYRFFFWNRVADSQCSARA